MAKPKKHKGEQRERATVVLRFSEDHLWVRVDGERAHVGVSDAGQRILGPILAAELPEVGEEIESGEPFGELESQRTVQELIAPLSGVVAAVNTEIDGNPGLVNEDPYRDGWLVEVKVSDEAELDDLMGPEAYDEFVEQREEDE